MLSVNIEPQYNENNLPKMWQNVKHFKLFPLFKSLSKWLLSTPFFLKWKIESFGLKIDQLEMKSSKNCCMINYLHWWSASDTLSVKPSWLFDIVKNLKKYRNVSFDCQYTSGWSSTHFSKFLLRKTCQTYADVECLHCRHNYLF